MERDIEDEIIVEKNRPQLDEASMEDEIIVEKHHPQLDEVSIVLLNSPYSLSETVEEIGSVSETLNEHCNVQCDDGDNDFKSALNIFRYDHVPPKKCNFWNYEICRSSEQSTACILCDLADDSVVPCSGNECPLAVHSKCAELDCDDPASSYCPYCWLKYQATRSMAVAAAKAHVRYGCTELKSGDIAIARENIQLENGSDKTLPMQLHENLHHIRKVVEQLKSLNLQLDESADQFIDMEKACGEASVVVNDQPKRVLWTVEEEDMLREGVERFSTKIKKNMPWKKILEMGKGVFHMNRSSSDLKDKWRNMVHM